ncbi:MAG TPA: glycosyltransferase, partial [Gemmatimonadaceae bacterium]|nr:glycosyltransferase [Gemmatimonadaceae bacterium]
MGARGRGSILILGEDSPGALMHSYAAAFRSLGFEVATYCLSAAFRGGIVPLAARIIGRVAPSPLIRRFNRRVRREVAGRRYSLALVLKGERLMVQTIRELCDATGAKWVNFYPDDPFSDVRSNRLVFGAEVLRAYDHCFTFGRDLVAAYQARGVERVDWLPFARDPEQHAPAAAVAAPDFDVVFAGNLDAERTRWLEPLAGRVRLAVAGEWTRQALPSRSPLRAATFLPAAYGPALASLLARGAISLNVLRSQNRLNHNMRSFESLACGAFTLSQRSAELEELFREDEEVAFVDAPAELPAVVERWLARPEDRARIARAGFERVAHDTYARRARTILECV